MLGVILITSSPSLIANTPAQTPLNQSTTQTQSIQQSLIQPINAQKTIENMWSEWGLTREEWGRYEELKKSARGIWSPNLDPLTMLGVEARNESERTRYAELLAKKEFQRTEKELAFQITYSRVFERLYPNMLPFKSDSTSTTSTATGRILYFTRTDCGQPCVDNLAKLWNIVGNKAVDIYIVDSLQDDKRIQDWAVKNAIDIEKVKNRQITLNHDSGYWLRYANGKMPAAFTIQGDGQWTQLVY